MTAHSLFRVAKISRTDAKSKGCERVSPNTGFHKYSNVSVCAPARPLKAAIGWPSARQGVKKIGQLTTEAQRHGERQIENMKQERTEAQRLLQTIALSIILASLPRAPVSISIPPSLCLCVLCGWSRELFHGFRALGYEMVSGLRSPARDDTRYFLGMPPLTGQRFHRLRLYPRLRRGPNDVGPYGPCLTNIRPRTYEKEC
jgi:hypothetical protein